MRKLAIITALMLTAGSAFAGDFEQAAQTGYSPSTGTAALVAFVLLVVGTVVFLWRNHVRTKLPIATVATAVVTMAGLQAGDFANAADAGYGLERRSGALVSGINAAGRANYTVYNYVQQNPMQALGYVYAYGDNSSTSRATAGAMIEAGRNTSGTSLNAAGPYPSQIAIGPLSGTNGGNYRWGTTLCDY